MRHPGHPPREDLHAEPGEHADQHAEQHPEQRADQHPEQHPGGRPGATAPAAPAGAPAIEAVDVTRSYSFGDSTVQALRGVSFTVDDGEYTAIVGPSGSGKSTLMHLLGCLDRPTSGVLRVGGRDLRELSDTELAELRNREIGFVFQSFQLLPRSTAVDNVALPLLYRGVKGAERRELAAQALRAVNLGHRLTHRPTQMSGGEQQRVAIARALVGEPRILLADEPTGNLDSRNGAEVMRILEELNAQRGVAVVLVTHDDEVAGRARRQVRVRDGLVASDSAASPRTGGGAA